MTPNTYLATLMATEREQSFLAQAEARRLQRLAKPTPQRRTSWLGRLLGHGSAAGINRHSPRPA
jgi:hypothetical protein